MQSEIKMDHELSLQKEKKLLAYLYASVADILDAVGAKDLTTILSKKVAEAICERSLHLDTNLALLSLLEDLSAWSVSIIKTNVLKGTLELRSVEMNVGNIPDFMDPCSLVDDLLNHSRTFKEQKLGRNVLPPSPPPDVSDVYLHQEEDEEALGPVSFSPNSQESPKSLSSESFTNLERVLTPASSNVGEDFEVLRTTLSPDPEKAIESPEQMDDDKTLMKIDIPSHKLPLFTKNYKKAIDEISRVFQTEVTVDVTTGCVSVRGLPKDCKHAIQEIKKVLDSPPVQEGKIYSLPAWMKGQRFTERIQKIAISEGCVVEEMIGTGNNMPFVFIQSERRWNIRRCIEKLQELENQCAQEEYGCSATADTSSASTDVNIGRIAYDRSQLLQVRNSSSLCPTHSPFLEQLTKNAQSLDILTEENW